MDMAASIPVDVSRGMLPMALISVMPAVVIMNVAGRDHDPPSVVDGTRVVTCTVEMAPSDGCPDHDQGDQGDCFHR